MKRIHLLKPGTFVGKDGKSYTFTGDDIRSIARSYDVKLSEAPIVIGHPDETAPAMGWIEKVEAEGDNLYVTPAKVQPAFSEAVKSHKFTKVTASLYSPDHPGNPANGEWYLQHVGFLGAQAPAVKGLEPIQFADHGQPAVVVSLSEGIDEAMPLLRRLLAVLRISATNPQLSEAAAAITAAADPSVVPSQESEVDQATHTAAITEKDTEIATLKQQLADRDAAAKASAATARKAEVAQFVEGAIKSGKLLPAEKSMVIELASRIEAGTTVQLAEGGAAVDLLASFKTFVEGLPKRLTTAEVANRGNDPDRVESTAQFSTPPGTVVNAERLEIHNKAEAYRAQNPNLSYEACVKHVSAAL